MAQKKILVVGSGGMVGRSAMTHFAALDGCEAVGMARRPAVTATEGMRFIAADLRNRDGLVEVLRGEGRFDQVLYAALYEEADIVSGWSSSKQIAINREMLANLLDAFEQAGTEFGHLTLIQGGKAYGVQFSPPKLPSRERDAPFFAPNFYFAQQDLIEERSAKADWTYTVLRPQVLCGVALGNPMNTVAGLGVYAAICRELGQPLRFPGGVPCFQQATDARLLARAIQWAGSEPRAAGEVYNIANGDIFSWQFIWPVIAKEFGVEPGVHQPFPMATVMPDLAPTWERIVQKHGLAVGWDQVCPSWQFMDFVFRHGSMAPHHSLLSTVKARQHGFHDCIDTEDMYRELFGEMKARKWLPDFG